MAGFLNGQDHRLDVEAAEGRYEPLIGQMPLERAQAVVDLAGHRLAKFDRVYLKAED